MVSDVFIFDLLYSSFLFGCSLFSLFLYGVGCRARYQPSLEHIVMRVVVVKSILNSVSWVKDFSVSCVVSVHTSAFLIIVLILFYGSVFKCFCDHAVGNFPENRFWICSIWNLPQSLRNRFLRPRLPCLNRSLGLAVSLASPPFTNFVVEISFEENVCFLILFSVYFISVLHLTMSLQL